MWSQHKIFTNRHVGEIHTMNVMFHYVITVDWRFERDVIGVTAVTVFEGFNQYVFLIKRTWRKGGHSESSWIRFRNKKLFSDGMRRDCQWRLAKNRNTIWENIEYKMSWVCLGNLKKVISMKVVVTGWLWQFFTYIMTYAEFETFVFCFFYN